MWLLFAIISLCACKSDAFLRDASSYFHHVPVFSNPSLRVGSFNIQVLGRSKFGKSDIIGNVTKVLLRYDLVSVLELRDSSETVADLLLNKINSLSLEPYQMVKGPRLGRTSIKEAYLFYYKPSKLSAETVYQYEDHADDFERAPMTVLWNSPTTELKRFATLAIHIKPTAVVAELEAIAKLFPVLQNKLHVQEVLLMGDLNSDCIYLTDNEYRNLSLSDPAHFNWLLPQHIDTTAHATDCAYDNIIVPVLKPPIQTYLVPGSVRTFNIETEMGYSQSLTEAVSDHYPIELQLRGQVNDTLRRGSELQQGFRLDMSGVTHPINDLRALYRTTPPSGYTVTIYRVGTRMNHVTLKAGADSSNTVRQRINALHSQYPRILPTSQVAAAERLLPGLAALPRVLGSPGTSPLYEVSLRCELDTSSAHTCSLSVSRHRL